MPDPEPQRKLATIVMADVVGYSRSMHTNERATHNRVQRLLRELIEPAIREHHGRLVDQRGDGFLSMFESPVEAVRCAIVIQHTMVRENLELVHHDRIRFRIGINLGDVLVQTDNIYGDGVNIAARLEALAKPGEIYISGAIYELVRYKLGGCGYQSLGDQKVKNIQDPIPTYRVLPDQAAIAKVAFERKMRWAVTLIAVLVLGGIGTAGWMYWHPSGERMETASAALPTPVTTAPPPPVIAPPPEPPKPKDPPKVAEAPKPEPPKDQPKVDPPPQQALLVQPPAKVEPPPPPPPPIKEPDMVSINGGSFQMGSNEDPSEQPIHRVTVAPFLVSKYPITVRQWRDCVNNHACAYVPEGNDDAPINNISWNDAQQYVSWLSKATHQRYRLLSEAEWEYAARGGTTTRFWWGEAMKPNMADCHGCGGEAVQPLKVGTRQANSFGLHDIGGGVAEWVEDCWVRDYHGAPTDGSARIVPGCRERVLRGGAWNNDASYVRSASRDFYDQGVRYPTHGLRIARSP